MRLLDPAKVSLTGIDLGQAIVAIVAVTVISGRGDAGRGPAAAVQGRLS